jgi:hypothetical protein
MQGARAAYRLTLFGVEGARSAVAAPARNGAAALRVRLGRS